MRNLTRDEQIAINQIAAATEAERQCITLYDARNESLALFRMKASRIVRDITIRHVTRMSQIKENRQFLSTWNADKSGGIGDCVRDFTAALERTTGRAVKF
jgi:hypothetical protein